MNVNRINPPSCVTMIEADGHTYWFEWLPTKEGAERVVRYAQSLVEREEMGIPTFREVCHEVSSAMAVQWALEQQG